MWRKLIVIGLIPLIIGLVAANDYSLTKVKNWFGVHESPAPTLLNAVGTIEVAFSPKNGATEIIVKAINDARETILASAYSFTSKEIAQALLNAKKRNIQIKIILDKSQVSQKYSSATFFANMGFDLRIDAKHAIYHNKVMVIDNKNVITGSFNFTNAAELKNAENVLILRNNPELAELYRQDFFAHWNHSVNYHEFAEKIKNKKAGKTGE